MKQQPSPFVTETLHEIAPLALAGKALRTHLMNDENVAWAWHSLIFEPLKRLTSEYDAHLFAAMIMQNLFSVDTRKNSKFPSKGAITGNANANASMSINMYNSYLSQILNNGIISSNAGP